MARNIEFFSNNVLIACFSSKQFNKAKMAKQSYNLYKIEDTKDYLITDEEELFICLNTNRLVFVKNNISRDIAYDYETKELLTEDQDQYKVRDILE